MEQATPRPGAGPAGTGVLAASMRVFDLSLGRMLWSRRTIFTALVAGLPVVVALVLRTLLAFEVPVMQGGVTGPVVFGLMFWGFVVRFAIPVLAVFYGTALIADEVEDRTITYLFTRPIPRASVVLGKYLAYLVCATSVLLPAVVLTWLLLAPIDGALAASFPDLVVDLVIVVVGFVAYGALFAAVGTIFDRPLLFGLLFVFGWENLALALPGQLRRASVAHYLQGLVPHAMPADTPLDVLQRAMTGAPGVLECALGLGLVTVAGLLIAARVVSNREYVLEH